MKSEKIENGALLRNCKGCGRPHDGTFATGKYCSKECSFRNRNLASREKALKRAVDSQPPHTLRVDRSGNEYRYIFLCQECKQKEVWHPVYYFSNPAKYGHLLNYTCRRCSNRHNWDEKRKPYEAVFSRLTEGATRRGIVVDLTFEEFMKFTSKGTCTYCGFTVVWYPRGNDSAHNLDRKDNSKGYSSENCVVCCGECNRIKSDQYSYTEMLRIGSVLKLL